MAITSTDIQNQGFTISKNGYKVEEVDDFLEYVSDEIDALNGQVADLESQLADSDNVFAGFDKPAQSEPEPVIAEPVVDTEALAQKDAIIADLQAQLADAKADGSAIAQVLIVAQRNADDIVANAQAQAGQIIANAQDKAAAIIDEANEKRAKVEQTIEGLEDERDGVRSGYQEMLKNFIADATSKLSALSAEERVVVSAHARVADSSTSSVRGTVSAQPAQVVSRKESEYVPAFAAPANQPVVAAVTPTPAVVEKDFSGFGDTDDDFGFDDID